MLALGMLPLGIAMQAFGAETAMLGLGILLLASGFFFVATMKGLRRYGLGRIHRRPTTRYQER